MRSYEAARGLFSLLGFLAWCAIIGGGIFALMAGGAAAEMRSFGGPPTALAIALAAAPGLGMSTMGLLGLAIVQNGRATVDTAELTQQMLKVARDQLDVSKQNLKQFGQATQSFSDSTMTASDRAGSPGYQSARSSGQAERTKERPPSIQPSLGLQLDENNRLTHKNWTILKRGKSYVVNGVPFVTLDEAKKYINENQPREA